MQYIPSNIQQKQKQDGSFYQKADLTDINGQLFEGVSAWNNELREGVTIEGEVVPKGAYLNFRVKTSTGVGKTAQIEKVMEKKNESIANFQDAKEKSIQHAGSITNATNLLVAVMMGMDNFDNIDDKNTWAKNKLRENIIFYQNLYKHPEDINPSSHDL